MKKKKLLKKNIEKSDLLVNLRMSLLNFNF